MHHIYQFIRVMNNNGYQVGFPANGSPKMAKNAFICTWRKRKVIKTRRVMHTSAVSLQ